MVVSANGNPGSGRGKRGNGQRQREDEPISKSTKAGWVRQHAEINGPNSRAPPSGFRDFSAADGIRTPG